MSKTKTKKDNLEALRAEADAKVDMWRARRAEREAREAEWRAAREAEEAKRGPYRSAPLDMQLATLQAERAKLEASAALAIAEHEASRAVDALEVATAGAAAFEVESTRAELRAMLEETNILEAQLRELRNRNTKRIAEVAAAWTTLAQTSARARKDADLPAPAFVPPAFFSMRFSPFGEAPRHRAIVEFALTDGAPAFTPPDHSDRLLQIRYASDKILAELERRRRKAEEQAAMEADYDLRAAHAEKERAKRAAEETAGLLAEHAAEVALADAARKRTEPYKEPKVTYQPPPKSPTGARI